MPRFLYSLLFVLGHPLVWLRLWWRGRANPAYRQRLSERYGRGPSLPTDQIWVHAVSVGEVIAAEKIVKRLLADGHKVLITTSTPTGSDQVKRRFSDSVSHVYAPYDIPSSVRRFISRYQPKALLIIETELWPNTIYYASQVMPIALLNGRLSAKSARGYAKFPQLSMQMLRALSLVGVQTQVEQERFVALGARKSCTQVFGNIKAEIRISTASVQDQQLLRKQLFGEAKIWVAASTHAGEDEIILAAHRHLLHQIPGVRLIIAPRHIERFGKVEQLIESSGFSVSRWSKKEADGQVILLDTLGDLLNSYAWADVAFVGGSLNGGGGHNVLEPAAWARPVLCGPSYFNFTDWVEGLRDANGLIVVNDGDELADTLTGYFARPDVALSQGENAQRYVQSNQGALDKTLTALVPVLVG